MGLKLVAPSTVDVVPLTLAKSHMRVDHPDENTIIQTYIKAAIAHLESSRGIGDVSFGEATWEQYHDAFPSGPLKLLQRPVMSVEKVEYRDPVSGVYVEWASTNYTKDLVSFDGWIVPNESWPDAKDAINAVKITFKAGFGSTTDSVPDDLKVAVLLLASHWYENRETVSLEGSPSELPFAVDALIKKYREIRL